MGDYLRDIIDWKEYWSFFLIGKLPFFVLVVAFVVFTLYITAVCIVRSVVQNVTQPVTVFLFARPPYEETKKRKKNNVVLSMPILNSNFTLGIKLRIFFFAAREMQSPHTRADHIRRVTALFSLVHLSLDERRLILSRFVSLLVDEETKCKLPSIFCSVLASGITSIKKDSFPRFEVYWRKHGYRVTLTSAKSAMNVLAYEFDPMLIENHGEASHFMILNLFALLCAVYRDEKERRAAEAILLSLAKRFNYGDIVWFYVKHNCGITADTILPAQVDKHSRSLLVAHFFSLRESEQLVCTVLRSPFDSRAVSLYRLLVTLFLAENEIVECLRLVEHIEKTVGITRSHFYLDVCQTRYPRAYAQLVDATSIKS